VIHFHRLLLTSGELLLYGIAVVKAEHWQFVPAAAVAAVVSDGTQLADEHCCSCTQHFHLSFLSFRLYWLVAMTADYCIGQMHHGRSDNNVVGVVE